MAVAVVASPAEAGANTGRGWRGCPTPPPCFWATSRELVLEKWDNPGFYSRRLP